MKIKNYLKEHKKELLVLLITIILCFIFLEVFVRVYYFSPLALSPSEGGHLIHIGRSGLIQQSDNCEIIYELKPNLDTYFKLTEFKTNFNGLRDVGYYLNKPDDSYRVAVLGDSLSMPSGVNIDDAYHSILEDKFALEIHSKRYEFINFAVGGYKLNQYLATLKNKSLEYNPDHVLVGICLTNDIPLKSDKNVDCDYQPEGTINTYIFPMSLFVLYSKTKAIIDSDKKEELEFDLEYLDSIIKEFKEISNENDFNITFVALRRTNTEDQIQFEIFNKTLTKYNFNFIDTSSEFISNEKNYWIYRFDHHPNYEANKIFAESIKKQLIL